jgi:hypothetical protein
MDQHLLVKPGAVLAMVSQEKKILCGLVFAHLHQMNMGGSALTGTLKNRMLGVEKSALSFRKSTQTVEKA